MLELIVNGRYVWLPLDNLSSLSCEPPSDLRDLVWLPAELILSNGGSTVALALWRSGRAITPALPGCGQRNRPSW